MCGRYDLDLEGKINSLRTRYFIEGDIPPLQSNYNVSPTQTMPVVTQNSPNTIVLMKWGIIPPWKTILFNIRDDSMLKKPWTKPYHQNRCIVVASGFSEFMKAGKERIPYRFGVEKEHFISLAGVYSEVDGVLYYSIITTEANEVVGKIHPRMPVILLPQEEHKWLDRAIPFKNLADIVTPYPEDMMVCYEVSRRVNNASNNDRYLTLPLSADKEKYPQDDHIGRHHQNFQVPEEPEFTREKVDE